MRFYGRDGDAPVARLAHECKGSGKASQLRETELRTISCEDALTAMMSGGYLETNLTIDPNDPPVGP